ncbi:glycoside hydrolase family 71 protein [Cylindrobasidium torrendii FP15055 ss-10]|uniref:Glycoside hydrolase family 71 protein n=1 Tax=Cylindrobasidium torrendii FP15055 ss-10 TaxID=1314674 RepID=A0A0D7BHV8_9AGAR|nr:glycoside hydrolase family 71 protein [Cylindrobasidium torrendii FP15055 ss-10]
MRLTFLPTLLYLSVTCALGAVLPTATTDVSSRAASGDKLVFAHFMMGIVSNRASSSDYDDDMRRAKAYGIDAFALNIGTDTFTDVQLEYAYQSAAAFDMKVFLSFDFNWYKPAISSAVVGAKIAAFASKPAQLRVDNKVFVSSFRGDGLDVAAVRSVAGSDLYFIPNFHPGQGDFSQIDGAFNWQGWDNDGNNKAPKGGVTVTVSDGDNAYRNALGNKPYMAPASPWFFTHYGSEVDYSKNWVFPGDLLWYNRWNEILQLAPRYVEIVTWNDYGESHYVGPLSSKHTDDGASKWSNDMPHNGWLDMAKPYIAAYKAGQTTVNSQISSDQIVYWYRPAPASVNCDSTDNTMGAANNNTGNYFNGRPDGWQTLNDNIFIVPLLTSAGTVTINSGGTIYSIDAPAGASSWSIPMHLGPQAFSLSRNNVQVMSATSLKEIKQECSCGLYNFNSYVGTVPAGAYDALTPDGLSAFTNGLKVACAATPSLPASPPATAAPTATGVAGGQGNTVPYIRKDGTTVTWLTDPNLQLTTPASGSYSVSDVWR